MKNRIPQSFLQEVLARSDIVEIIRSRVKLTQRGDKHLARCPFHQEKTPSFNVSHIKQFYYCFGCGAGGNAIGFLMAYDQMGFREAVTYLATQIGLEIPKESGEDNTQVHAVLYQMMEEAIQHYCKELRGNMPAIQYLRTRGVSGSTAKKFAIGYAPGAWNYLEQRLADTPEKLAALIECGLLIQKEKARTYDRFRERITFPIRNIQGKIIGLGGRTITQAQPKYLNSPETPLFHKGQELYGLYEARKSGPMTQLIVVEGYMDVVILHQYGITQAVATLGTAVTAMQIQKCLRYVNQLIFCFDGDRAGRQAAWKALTITLPLLREGIHIQFLFLPEKEDPDSQIQKIGAKAFLKLLEQAPPLSEVFFKELKNKNPLLTPADKAQFGQEAMGYLNTMPHGLFRQLMCDQLAQELNLDSERLAELMQPQTTPLIERTAPHSTKNLARTRQRAGVMSPPLRAVRALLQKQNGPLSESILQCIQEWPEISVEDKLLKQISQILTEHPTLNFGILLSHIEDETQRKILTDLASQEALPISVEEAHTELWGALNALNKQRETEEMQEMVEKAKKSQLNLEEKRKLQNLLSKLKKDACER
jgi:DNA primase